MTSANATGLSRVAFLAATLLSAGSSPALSANYAPADVDLVSLTQSSQGTTCVVGTSQATGNVPAYYLKSNKTKSKSGKSQWVWAPLTSSTSVTPLQLGSNGASILFVGTPYVNAGNVRVYIVNAPCASIPSANYVLYPSGLLEVSTYPIGNSNFMTIDVSNVDSFQIPMQLAFTNGMPAATLGLIGNPVTPGFMSLRTMITGPAGNGSGSPFNAWLQGQPGYQSGPNLFAPLLLSSETWSEGGAGSFPFAMLQSPTDYLVAACQTPTAQLQVPAQCGLGGKLLHPQDPLDHYYDHELATFFANARQGLVVMGDAHGAIAQQAWTVDSQPADCPAYLHPDHVSLSFKSNASQPIVVCNPLGQVIPLDTPPTNYVQEGSKATVDITAQQYGLYKGKVGWNFGQPESSWIAVVDGFTQNGDGSYRMNLQVLATPTAAVSQHQAFCSAPKCATVNTSFTNWAFTNIRVGTSINPFESASRMVFANDGAFSSWLYYPVGSDEMIVTQSIERNIVWAFNHGIANCNNITKAQGGTPPSYCQKVKTFDSKVDYTKGAFNASDAYWANEANWYPAGGPQNYYAQYLHTAQLNSSGIISTAASCPSCFSIFAPPNGQISGSSASNQGVPMGMAYGFAYDENPDYLTVPSAQVPSKLDPIPKSFETGVGVTLTIGRSQ